VNKPEKNPINFQKVYQEFQQLACKTKNLTEIMEQTAELLKSQIDYYNWVGFYLLNESENHLRLGPFSGKPTEHVTIPVGKGVCGQVALNKIPMIVQDVTLQDNYIACSLDVQSEIVVPILKKGKVIAEIDIDSHAYAPFSDDDEKFLIQIAADLSEHFI
jgi:GAF domain-containing protein